MSKINNKAVDEGRSIPTSTVPYRLIYGGVATSDNDEWNILLKSILELGVIGIIREVDPELLFSLDPLPSHMWP